MRCLTKGMAILALLTLLPSSAQGAGRAPTPRTAGHIAFVGNDGNLYVVRPDGMGKRALTRDGTVAPYAAPLWSPNGTSILSLRFYPSPGLWLVSTSGGARQIALNVPRGFAWAPDGHTVVYEEGFPPGRTVLVQFDTRSGHARQIECDGAFMLVGITSVGNRAIGLARGQIVAIGLSGGSEQTLTRYPPRAGVWHNVAVVTGSGGAVLYGVEPGNKIVSLDLRSGRSRSATVSGALKGIAPSSDLRGIAYSIAAGDGAASALLYPGKPAVPLRGASYITSQAFNPGASALVFTSLLDGPAYIFTTLTTCPARCARRLGPGHDAAWGP